MAAFIIPGRSTRRFIVALLVLVCSIAGHLPLHSCQENYYDPEWKPAGGTWYGDPDGDGSDGGACGYGVLSTSPYGSSIAAGNSPLFLNGSGCGVCYEVKCNHTDLCKPTATDVVITDLCPGGAFCDGSFPHFDLSGNAISNMAISGQEEALRTVAVYDLLYRRIPCSYPGQNISFTVDSGSNPFWFSLIVKYEGGPGDIQAVQIKQAGNDSGWQAMTQNWGANWMVQSNTGSALQGPLSIRLATQLTGQVVVAADVIPAGYDPGATYESSVQF
ncbi:hypothetical protein BDL97_17G068300 [Sphagnum fallax]|nr:hypothetical protein BDL97_17G068300 [Sphagnum fallax]